MFRKHKNNENDENSESVTGKLDTLDKYKPALIAGLGIGAVVGFAAMRYRVSGASQYVVRTGPFINGISISKKAFQWPFQTASFLTMAPSNYTFNLQAMSKEKMEFVIPGVFTIGPRDDAPSMEKYALLLGAEPIEKIDKIIEGVIEGETRVLAASMEIEGIFNGRDQFKQTIISKVQEELNQFGLVIYNANVKELQDMSGSEYFKHMRQKTRSGAENQARVEIANAKYKGDVGEKEKQKDTRIQTAQFESEAVQFENDRNVEMARSVAQFQIEKATFDKNTRLAQIESEKAAKIRESELQKEVENRNIAQETEKLRSTVYAQAVVQAEAKERAADVERYKTERLADASLYAKQKEAAGILEVFNAQAKGFENLMGATSNPDIALKYLMIEGHVYQDLASENAKAIQGLQPKISHWVTGGDNKQGNPIQDLMKNLPPLIDQIHHQTGMLPPNWLMQTGHLPNQQLAETVSSSKV